MKVVTSRFPERLAVENGHKHLPKFLASGGADRGQHDERCLEGDGRVLNVVCAKLNSKESDAVPVTDETIFEAKSRDGVVVRALKGSHLETHADIMPYLPQVLDRIDLAASRGEFDGDQLIKTVTVAGFQGKANVVKRQMGDELRSFIRGDRPPSVGAINRKPEPTDEITVIMNMQLGAGEAMIVTAWAGGKAQKEPADPTLAPSEVEPSRRYWRAHVFALERPADELSQIGVKLDSLTVELPNYLDELE